MYIFIYMCIYIFIYIYIYMYIYIYIWQCVTVSALYASVALITTINMCYSVVALLLCS